MEKKVLETIIEENLINPGDNIVLGLSGGHDSMALLHSLIYAKKQIDFNLILAHLNHGVRGEYALRDENFVIEQGRRLNLKCYTKKADMVSYGKDKGITAEEAGRELRYGFFREILKDYGGGKIAVAHNKEDQAETLIMRIFRGTGIDGLVGMEFLSEDIIRPILNISRDEIEKYIEENNIATVIDDTNLLPMYTRNKIRLELIPYIKEHFNPNIIDSLWRLSQTSKIDSAFLEGISLEKYKLVLEKEERESIILNGRLFKNLDTSMQQRIIRKCILHLLEDIQGYSEEHIKSINNLFLFGETGKSLNLPRKVLARVDYDNLILKINKNEEDENYIYPLYIGDNRIDELDYDLNLEIIDSKGYETLDKNKLTLFLDWDKVQGELFIRNRRTGDKFTPYGMKGSKKIKDYFIDEKISREMRNKIPFIVDRENIIWIVGYRSNDLYKITKDTKNILKIKIDF